MYHRAHWAPPGARGRIVGRLEDAKVLPCAAPETHVPTRPPLDLTLSPWWGEFLAVKDRLSWSALAARFGESANQLNLALASAGLTKQPLPPGRKPRALVGL